jgi:diaminohydroxyphosphoribosylaminopyrimidine deaminase/5-amino-6-(5-phosphoribosylamino)uracil reductase
MFSEDERYMSRCLQLAKLGAGNVAPNPMVGAVLVNQDSIIGEGWHQEYGKAHAEVNCINSVNEADKHLIKSSTLYVSLEPCAHFGKTPPCSDLIIQNKIPKVVIGCRDPFKEVNGRGIEKLKAANIETVTGVLENQCRDLNKPFFTFHQKFRPYIILKWAQTANKKIAYRNENRLKISNLYTDKLVHKWRSESSGILVGTQTALLDNPSLTNRLWNGNNPVRLVVDQKLKLSDELNIFDKNAPTIVFTLIPIINIMLSSENSIPYPSSLKNKTYHYKLDGKKTLPQEIATACYHQNLQTILVEGGARLLQSFIDENLYDEIRIITNEKLFVKDGMDAPVFPGLIKKINSCKIFNDAIEIYQHAE